MWRTPQVAAAVLFLKGLDEVDSALRDPKLQPPLKKALAKQGAAVQATLTAATTVLLAAGQAESLRAAVAAAGLQLASEAVLGSTGLAAAAPQQPAAVPAAASTDGGGKAKGKGKGKGKDKNTPSSAATAETHDLVAEPTGPKPSDMVRQGVSLLQVRGRWTCLEP